MTPSLFCDRLGRLRQIRERAVVVGRRNGFEKRPLKESGIHRAWRSQNDLPHTAGLEFPYDVRQRLGIAFDGLRLRFLVPAIVHSVAKSGHGRLKPKDIVLHAIVESPSTPPPQPSCTA